MMSTGVHAQPRSRVEVRSLPDLQFEERFKAFEAITQFFSSDVREPVEDLLNLLIRDTWGPVTS